MFRITDNKGFQITFPNGWTVSVQFGHYNYCANYHEFEYRPSPDAEIAAWKGDEWYDFGNDTVKGYVSPAEVLAFMNMIAAKE